MEGDAMNRIQVISCVIALLWSGIAAAGDGIVEKFFGSFSGTSTWGSGLTPRDINVVIQPLEHGFNVSWDTISLRDPRNPKRKTHAVDFVKTPDQTLYVSKAHKDRTDVPLASDPLQGPMPKAPLIWARVNDNTLSLYAFERTDDGRPDVQAYHRTLHGDKMKLHFIRYIEGKAVKQAKGKMRRAKERAK